MSETPGLGLGMRGGLGAANAPARRAAPTNEQWASQKAPVGLKLLQKMGWEDGKGLGANEDGRVSHIRVTRKTGGIGVGAKAADIKRGWETPGAVASGLNDVLARLNAVSAPAPAPASTPADAADAAAAAEKTPVAESDAAEDETRAAKARKKRKAGRGFYERKRALKTVGKYSKQELAEIFGAAGSAPSGGLKSVGNLAATPTEGEEAKPSAPVGNKGCEDDGRMEAEIEEESESDADEATTAPCKPGLGSVSERSLSKKVKKLKAELMSNMDGVVDGMVKKSKKKKKKKKKSKGNTEKLTWTTGEVEHAIQTE